jgi:polysaccharide biosynthesis/export protein
MWQGKTTHILSRKSTLSRTVLLGAVLFGAGPMSNAQLDGPPDARAAKVEDRPAVAGGVQAYSVLPAESLGADDLLEITVSYCPELSHNFRISSDGTLSLPMLHEKLKVAGLTPIQVSDELQRALVGEGILADPTVNISVVEYRSRPVNVVGAVNHPLTFQATGHTSLLDALANAGGLSPTAGNTVIVTVKSISPVQGVQDSSREVSTKDLFSGADPQFNLVLHGGEEIRVPEASKIFVAGNVRRPGMYPMLSESQTTVVKAIALSEGLDSYSAPAAYIYRKRTSGEERDELKVSLSRIMTHKDPDVALKADDILYIPSSDGKRLAGKLLNELAGFGQTAGSGLLIYK